MKETSPVGSEALNHRGDEPHLLREIFRTYQVLIAGFANATGMPVSRFALMRLLASADGEVGITQLARWLAINPAAVSRQVKDLESERLVKRRADARDGRRSYITLSPKGRTLFEEVHERTHELERSLESVIGADEMRDAAMVLMKLRTFIESLLGEGIR